MQAITHNAPNIFLPLTKTNGDHGDIENLSKTPSSQTTIQVQKKTDFILMTQEGDKVSLSSSASQETGFATYNSQGFIDGEGAETPAEGFYWSEEFGLEFSVEGELNKRELHDVLKAFRTIEKLATDFYKNKTDQAIKRASKLAELDTISGFEGTLQYERSVSHQTTMGQALPPPSSEALQASGLPEEAPVPPAILDSKPDETTQATLAAPPDPESGLTVEMKQLVEKITAVIMNTSVETEKLLGPTNRFLERILGFFPPNRNEGQNELQTLWEIQSESIQGRVESGKGEETGASENA